MLELELGSSWLFSEGFTNWAISAAPPPLLKIEGKRINFQGKTNCIWAASMPVSCFETLSSSSWSEPQCRVRCLLRNELLGNSKLYLAQPTQCQDPVEFHRKHISVSELCLFAKAAVSNYHKLGSWKQQKCILPQFGVSFLLALPASVGSQTSLAA